MITKIDNLQDDRRFSSCLSVSGVSVCADVDQLPKLFQSCLKVVSKLSQSCPKVVPKLSQSSTKVVSKLSQICPKVVPKLSQSCRKVVSKLYHGRQSYLVCLSIWSLSLCWCWPTTLQPASCLQIELWWFSCSCDQNEDYALWCWLSTLWGAGEILWPTTLQPSNCLPD